MNREKPWYAAHGLVLWRGGSGHPGTRGGWGFRCKHCNEGVRREAAPTRKKAEEDFSDHLIRKHNYALSDGQKQGDLK